MTRFMRYPQAIVTGICFLIGSAALFANEADRDFFEKKIRPALVMYCYECHSAESKKVNGELLLDSREGIRKGGESGPSLHLGVPDESLLIKALRYTDEAVKMPPKGKLPDAVIADFEEWVKRGAFDPRDNPLPKSETASWDELMIQRSD